MDDDQATIHDLLEDMACGYRARDPERVAGHFDPGIVNYSLAPPLRGRRGDLQDLGGGRSADLTTVEGVGTWMAGFGDAPFDYEIRDVEVVVGGAVAYAHGLARMGSPGAFSLWFRFTVGLRKHDDVWRIAHLHSSTPFHMDGTMRAATDLQP